MAFRLHDELLHALALGPERVGGGKEGVEGLAEDGHLRAAVVAAQFDSAAAGAVGLIVLGVTSALEQCLFISALAVMIVFIKS